MNTPEVHLKDSTPGASVARADMRLEVVIIPVLDVDRTKEFYGRLRWRLDADFPFDNGFRVVQFTPTGSACSIQFGAHITSEGDANGAPHAAATYRAKFSGKYAHRIITGGIGHN